MFIVVYLVCNVIRILTGDISRGVEQTLLHFFHTVSSRQGNDFWYDDDFGGNDGEDISSRGAVIRLLVRVCI